MPESHSTRPSPIRRKALSLLALLALGGLAPVPPGPLVVSQALAGAPAPTPAPAPTDPGAGNVTTPEDVLSAFANGQPIPGFETASNAFMSVDSTIAMLARAIDILAAVPVIGPIAMTLKPILNTYLDMKTTVQPILDTINRGREYVGQMLQAKQTMTRMFQSGSFGDAVSNVNTLVNQFGGLTNLPASQRKISASDPQKDVANILKAADQQINQLRQDQQKARQRGDAVEYRTLLQREQEARQLRARIRQAGEVAAAQKDALDLASRSNQVVGSVGQKTAGYANNLITVSSAEGATKVLGSIALDQLNANAAGFDTLSQQLALLSKQQTIANEQGDQLLSYFQEQQRKEVSQARQAIEAENERQEEAYKRMVNRSDTLSLGIGQTLKPSAERSSNVADLMRGVIK